jgi:succinate-semialdehyde dehydrogenase / glutarate-semialdehyde dehydrogenase
MSSIASINPWTGLELARFPNDDPAKVDASLSEAAGAQAHWRKVDIRERVMLLGRLARALRAGKERYARLITLEMGKPISEAEGEIEKCAWNCDFYADMAPVYLADEAVRSKAGEASVVFDPLGVVLAIMPWNYPFWQFFRFAAPAFAAGNGVILKHANNVPQCALAIQALVEAAGAPPGLLRTLLVEASEVAAIIADDRIAAVTLTGSTRVGSLVAAQAGAALKKQVLELGGSDPFIVLADADIETAANVAIRARFLNAGQSCVNAKRFIVEERVADGFMAAFSAGVERLRLGDPLQRDTDIGPMARANLRADLHEQVQRTLDAGGELRVGGSFASGPGFGYAPTVIDRVTPQMAAFREETFGPVAAIRRAKDVEDAITLANRTEFGLGASLWTRDIDRARRLARHIDAGAVFINSMVASSPELPFGGIKKSGYGRELGSYGVREFVNIKTVCVGSK